MLLGSTLYQACSTNHAALLVRALFAIYWVIGLLFLNWRKLRLAICRNGHTFVRRPYYQTKARPFYNKTTNPS